jgi:hypothetical protein
MLQPCTKWTSASASLPKIDTWVATRAWQALGYLVHATGSRQVYVACAHPSVTADVEQHFRKAGRIYYFEVRRIVPGETKDIVFWDQSLQRPVATPR